MFWESDAQISDTSTGIRVLENSKSLISIAIKGPTTRLPLDRSSFSSVWQRVR